MGELREKVEEWVEVARKSGWKEEQGVILSPGQFESITKQILAAILEHMAGVERPYGRSRLWDGEVLPNPIEVKAVEAQRKLYEESLKGEME